MHNFEYRDRITRVLFPAPSRTETKSSSRLYTQPLDTFEPRDRITRVAITQEDELQQHPCQPTSFNVSAGAIKSKTSWNACQQHAPTTKPPSVAPIDQHAFVGLCSVSRPCLHACDVREPILLSPLHPANINMVGNFILAEHGHSTTSAPRRHVNRNR